MPITMLNQVLYSSPQFYEGIHIIQMLPLNGLRMEESQGTKGMSERARHSSQEAPPSHLLFPSKSGFKVRVIRP